MRPDDSRDGLGPRRKIQRRYLDGHCAQSKGSAIPPNQGESRLNEGVWSNSLLDPGKLTSLEQPTGPV